MCVIFAAPALILTTRFTMPSMFNMRYFSYYYLEYASKPKGQKRVNLIRGGTCIVQFGRADPNLVFI